MHEHSEHSSHSGVSEMHAESGASQAHASHDRSGPLFCRLYKKGLNAPAVPDLDKTGAQAPPIRLVARWPLARLVLSRGVT